MMLSLQYTNRSLDGAIVTFEHIPFLPLFLWLGYTATLLGSSPRLEAHSLNKLCSSSGRGQKEISNGVALNPPNTTDGLNQG